MAVFQIFSNFVSFSFFYISTTTMGTAIYVDEYEVLDRKKLDKIIKIELDGFQC